MASQQDIYNYIAEVKRDRLKGQSSIHALAKQLEEDGFWKETQVDHDSRVTGLLFAHPRSLAYLEAYPDILILDCTYKTNKYKMPLLDMVGVDACGRSFCIAFAFLNGEAEEDYLWALGSLRAIYERAGIRHPSVILTDRCLASMNSISTCFPAAVSLLCLWHANKAVLSRCRPAFTKYHQGPIADADGISNWDAFYSHWHAIVNSKDEAAYHKAVQDIEKQYLHSHLNEVTYIRTTWLEPYKEKLVKAWVDKHCHFNNVVTSRAEGIHSLLKSYLKVSQLDLFDAWRSIKNALFNQLSELQIIQAKQQSRTLLELSQPLYHAVHGWVSYDALYKVDAQRKRLLKGDLPACTGAFTRSQGLPCAHMLLHIQEQGSQALQLQHFHTQWHLRRTDTHQLLLEPHRRFDRVTMSSRIPQSSTQREPSGYEAVEAVTRPRAQPQCSRCHIRGHTRSSKACPQRYEDLLLSSLQTLAAEPRAHPEESPAAASPAAASPAAASPAASYTSSHTSTHTSTHTSAQGTIRTSYTTTHTAIISISPPPLTPPLRHDHPLSIYQRYLHNRELWYMAQPRGSLKTNQEYRRVNGLPARYSKAQYAWCLDYKQMGKRCTDEGRRSRDWTKEEMMAYLDFDEAENRRVNAQVEREIADQPFSNRRGMRAIWEAAENDIKEQHILHFVE